jgi:hypothetical protein
VVHGTETWLPVNRLSILVLGLLGRYGNREDRGHAASGRNAARLDNEVDDAREDGLYGSTVLRHVRGTDREDLERVYFCANGKALRGGLRPDNVPLSTLFWLSVGRLPVGKGRVFDLAGFQGRYESRFSDRGRVNRTDDEAWRFQEPFVSHRAFRYERLADEVTSSRYSVWARAMGCEMGDVLTYEEYELGMEEVEYFSDTVEFERKGEGTWSAWAALRHSRRTSHENDYVWKSDVQCLTFGLLTLVWSPQHFLFAIEGKFRARHTSPSG